MNAARSLLLLAATTLLATVAAQADPPAIGFAEGHSTSHERAVLTVSFTATYDAATRKSDVTFTCAASQPSFDTWLECTVYAGSNVYEYQDHPFGPTALVSTEIQVPADDDVIEVCANLRNTIVVPQVCATGTV